MDHLYTTYSERLKQSNTDESAKRSLKRLRIALMVWVVSFFATIVWMTIVS